MADASSTLVGIGIIEKLLCSVAENKSIEEAIITIRRDLNECHARITRRPPTSTVEAYLVHRTSGARRLRPVEDAYHKLWGALNLPPEEYDKVKDEFLIRLGFVEARRRQRDTISRKSSNLIGPNKVM